MKQLNERIRRLEGEHENIRRGRIPTHRCKVCDTFWLDLRPEHDAMTMVGIWCGETCCEGTNIEKLPTLSGSDDTERGQLLQLLRDIKSVFAGDAAPNWVNRYETTALRGHYLDRIDMVLGLVGKEN